MLPPPTTTATSVPSSAFASASSRAMRSTTGPSMVSSDAVLAKASPDSFSTTRRHLVRRPAQFDQHAVDAAVVLHVEVRVDHVARTRLVADHLTELDVLLEGDLQVVDRIGALLRGGLPIRRDGGGQVVGHVDEGRR